MLLWQQHSKSIAAQISLCRIREKNLLKNSLHFLSVVVIVLLLLNLTACGFKLRGQNVLPPSMHFIGIQSATPYGDFESAFKRSLVELGASVARTDSAPVTIHILNKLFFHDVPTIGGSNQARVYNYYYQVTFELRTFQNQVILPVQTVSTSQMLVVNAGTALEANNQLEIIEHEMQLEIIHMIINILNSPELVCPHPCPAPQVRNNQCPPM